MLSKLKNIKNFLFIVVAFLPILIFFVVFRSAEAMPILTTGYTQISAGSPSTNLDTDMCGNLGHFEYLSYTAPTNSQFGKSKARRLQIDTNGSNFDTVLYVFDTSTNPPTIVAYDDNSGTDGVDSELSFEVNPGKNYSIEYEGKGGWGSNASLNINFIASTGAPATKFSCASIPISNPILSRSCGIDVAIALDNSGSISQSELIQMKDAVKAFVNVLSTTGTRFSVTSFATNATIQNNFTDDKNIILSAIDAIPWIPDGSTYGYTNWEDGLLKSSGTFSENARPGVPRLVIFASDGNPTTDHRGFLIPSLFDPQALVSAFSVANAVKSSGIRILTIGIGNHLNIDSLKEISGPNINTGEVNVDVVTTNFGAIANDLTQLETTLCGGTITTKEVLDIDGDLSTINDQVVRAGLAFVVAGQTLLTDSTGRTVPLQVNQGTYSVLDQNNISGYEPLSASCATVNQGNAPRGINSSPGAITGITVGLNDVISCTFYHKPAAKSLIADIKANGSDDPVPIPFGKAAVITWTSTSTSSYSCTVTNDQDSTSWNSPSGTQYYIMNIVNSPITFTERCTGSAGIATDSVTVNVTLPLNVLILGTGDGTVSSSPVGINCSKSDTPCITSFIKDTSVVLTASSTMGTFAGWGGCDSTIGTLPTQTCKVTMGAVKFVTATFNSTNAPNFSAVAGNSVCSANTVSLAWKINDSYNLTTRYKIYRDGTFFAEVSKNQNQYVYSVTAEDKLISHSYIISAFYNNDLNQTNSEQFFIAGCGKTIFNSAFSREVTVYKDSNQVGVSELLSQLISGVSFKPDLVLTLKDDKGNNFDVPKLENSPNPIPAGSLRYGTVSNTFGCPTVDFGGDSLCQIIVYGIDKFPVGQYTLTANQFAQDTSSPGSLNSKVTATCITTYIPDNVFSVLTCINNYNSNVYKILIYNNSGVIFNNGSSKIARVAYADTASVTSGDISQEPWKSATVAFADTICNSTNTAGDTGNWSTTSEAGSTKSFTCDDRDKSIPTSSANVKVNVVSKVPASRATEPSCKVGGVGTVEVYITPSNESEWVYEISWKKHSDLTYSNSETVDTEYDYPAKITLADDGEYLYHIKNLPARDNSSQPILYDVMVRGQTFGYIWSEPSYSFNIKPSECDPEEINLSCSGVSGYPTSPISCVSEYGGSVALTPKGQSSAWSTFWDSCTPTSAPSHSGWDGGSWISERPSSSKVGDDDSEYKDFSATGGLYNADSLNQKEYTFTWTCSKTKAGAITTSVPKYVNVCVKPPPVDITGYPLDSSTIVVTWNKPAVHNSFGLRYKLNIDRTGSLRTVDIGNQDTTFANGNGSCDSTKCTYHDNNLPSDSTHTYQLQVLADYDKCDPKLELSADPKSEATIYIPKFSCSINLGINGNPGTSSFVWKSGDPSPTINWITDKIPAGGDCQVVGNIDGFSGSVDCSSGSLKSKTLSALADGSYTTYLKYGASCQSQPINLTKISTCQDFCLSATSPIELVAVGSPVGKNIKSSKSAITISKASGFNENVTLTIGDVKVKGVTIDKSKFFFDLTSGSNQTLQVWSTDLKNPIPDGSYEIIINGLSASNISHSANIILNVRTVSPEYKEY